MRQLADGPQNASSSVKVMAKTKNIIFKNDLHYTQSYIHLNHFSKSFVNVSFGDFESWRVVILNIPTESSALCPNVG